MSNSSQAVVDRLCEASNIDLVQNWSEHEGHYLASCRVSQADVPRLIAIAQRWTLDDPQVADDELEKALESHPLLPVMAWQALGELRSVDAVEPLLGLLVGFGDEFDEWSSEELPLVFGKIGAPAVDRLIAFAEHGEHPEIARSIVIRGLAKIADYEPDTRQTITPALTDMLSRFEDEPIDFNTTVMTVLHDLGAVEAAETIERAFSANAIDVSLIGDWEKVRSGLGVEGMGLPMPVKPYNSLGELFENAAMRMMRAQFADDESYSESDRHLTTERSRFTGIQPATRENRVGRNEACPCGSGKKFKKCCGP